MPSWLHCMAHVTQHGRRHYLHLFLLLTLIQASRKIPIKILKSNKPFIPRAAKKGQPQIFRSTSLLKKWTAFSSWTNNTYLSNVCNEDIDGIYMHTNSSVFGPFYDVTRPLASLSTVTPEHNYVNVRMSMKDFLKNISHHHSSSSSTYFYLTREIERVHPSLESDITPLNELIRLNPKFSSVNLWIGQQGVVGKFMNDSVRSRSVNYSYC